MRIRKEWEETARGDMERREWVCSGGVQKRGETLVRVVHLFVEIREKERVQ